MIPFPRKITPALLVACATGVLTLLYATGRRYLADEVLVAWGMRPFRFLFLDTDTVLSALRCLRQGVDVFETNPCDALGRVYDYSPLWLHAAVLPITEAWIFPVGLGVVVLFILSLLALPVGRSWGATLVISVGCLSTATVFALERANNDVVIFVLAVLAAVLVCRSPAWRWLGYACALLAGLLKYYPMLLMALALRERPRMFFAVAAASVAVFALFVVAEYGALQRALGLIPVGSYFGDMFGASTLPFGVAQLTRHSLLAARVGEVALVIGAIGLGAWISARPGFTADLARLTEPERVFLLAGALLIIGCFSTAQNIGYRALHLILVLPAVTALARRGGLWAITTAVLLALLWAEGWRHWLDAAVEGRPIWVDLPQAVTDVPRIAGWLLRELCWWWVVTMLWSVAIAAVRQSAMARALGYRPVPA